VSVGVSCYTLVAISLERYYAICQPFKSRLWQTYAHARRMLIAIWSFVLLVMGPIAAFHRVITIQTGGHACREVWPEVLLHFKLDLVYSVTLAVLLLLIPLVLMCAYYGLMGKQLWMTSSSAPTRTPQLQRSLNRAPKLSERDDSCLSMKCEGGHRSTHDPTNRKRVIRMLVVIVLQYFVCWTPLYLLNTWNAFDFRSVLRHISPTTKSLILLVAYTSSFIHPITYCFMNRNFRNGFRQSVRCRKCSNQQFATQSLRVFSASGHQGLLGNRPK
ncbi:CCKAR-like protein, partial [Mya arenaria]